MRNPSVSLAHLSVILVFLSLASLAGADCVGPPALQSEIRAHPRAKTFIRLGAWFDARRQYECAAQAYRSALKLDPKSAQAFELLGGSLYSAGDLSAAVEALQRSIEISPGILGPHLKRAQALEQLRRADEAKSEWQSALKFAPASTAALDGMSRHLTAQGDYAGVANLLRPVPDAVRTDESLALDLAQAYGKLGMLEDAEAVLKTALALHSTSFPLTFALTTVLMNKVYFKEATEVSEGFAAAHPQNVDAQRLLLRVLITSQDSARAAPLARKLLEAHPEDAYFLYANGLLERQAGDYAAARLHLQQSVILNPNFSSAHFNLGMALAKLDDPGRAKQQFEEALALGDQEPELHFELSKVLKSLGETAEAQKELALYREKEDSRSTSNLVEGTTVKAEQELASGNPQKAIALYKEALQAAPNDALLNYKLSVALDGIGDTAAERAALEKAIQIDPDMAIAQNQLGYLESRSGDSAGAEEHFRQAVRAAPAYTEAWINLAATLGMESKFPEAQTAVASALKLDPQNSQALQLRQDLAAAQEQQK